MIEKVLHRKNLYKAYHQVVSNKEAAGIDRMQVYELKSFIDNNRIPVLTSILDRKGMPQGSPLSPLLSNILLGPLDKYLKSEGPKYVRYADDCAPRMVNGP